MPTYEYRCERGHHFDEMQRMADDPLTECRECGAPVQRVFHPVAVHFKGSGFYNTDYGKKKAASSSDSKGDTSSSETRDTKKDTKSSSSNSGSKSSSSSSND